MAERGRAQVAADAGELALLVAERGLDHEVRDLHAAQPLPQQRVRAGVAGKDPPAPVVTLAGVDREADGRHGVRGAQRAKPDTEICNKCR